MKAILSLSFALLSFTQQVFSAPSNVTPRSENLNVTRTDSTQILGERATLANVITSCTKANTAALTFDDGVYVYMYDISKTLLQYGAKGTFFVNGNNYECIYDNRGKRLKYLHNKGHQLASHSWSHADMAKLTWDQIHHEMWLVEQAFQRLIGKTPAFMRPPFGSYNDLVRQASAIRGQTIALWDFDSGDSTGATAQQSKDAYTALANKKPKSILALNHETTAATTFDILPHAIQKLQAKGYKLVTLAECLDMPAYQPATTTPIDADFTCEPQLKTT